MTTVAMTLRTDAELDAALTELAERHRMSKQEVVRAAVLEKAERESHRARMDRLAVEVAADYADALDRLGSV